MPKTLMANEENRPGENLEIEDVLSDLDMILTGTELISASTDEASAQTPVIPPLKQPESARTASPNKDLKIELGSAMGISKPSVPAPTNPSAGEPAVVPAGDSAASASKADVQLPGSALPINAAPVVVPPKVVPSPIQTPKTSPSPKIETQPPVAVIQTAALKPIPVSPPAATVPLARVTVTGAEIPENIPNDQIRTLAFLYMADSKGKFEEFIQFIDSMALQLTKKPLYLRKAMVLELSANPDYPAVIGQIRASGATGAVGIFPEPSARGIEEAFSQVDVFFRSIYTEDVGKRSAALDLLVDVTLLTPG